MRSVDHGPVSSGLRLWQVAVLTRRKALGLVALGVVLCAIGGLFALPLVAGAVIRAKAASRGLLAVTANPSVGIRGIWFERLDLKTRANSKPTGVDDPSSLADVSGHVGPVCIRWRSLLGRTDVGVFGGRIEVTGTTQQLKNLTDGRSHQEKAAQGAAHSMSLELSNVDVAWRQRPGEAPSCSIDGLEAKRSEDAFGVRFRRGHCRKGALSVEALGGQWERSGGSEGRLDETSNVRSQGKRPWQAAMKRVQLEFNLAEHAVSQKGDAVDQNKPQNGPGATQEPNPSRRAVTPTEGAELFRRMLTASDPETRERIDAIAHGSSLQSGEVLLRLVNDDQKLDLGPWRLRIERDAAGVTADLTENQGKATSSFSGSFRLRPDERRSDVRLTVGPTTLRGLGVTDGDFGLKAVERTRVQLTANVTVDAKLPEVALETEGEVEGLAFRQPWLAKSEVAGLHLTWAGSLALEPARRRALMKQFRIGLGKVSAQIDGTVQWGKEGPDLDFIFEVPIAACQDFLDALPTGLAPSLSGWRVDGTFGLKIKVLHHAQEPDQSAVALALDNHCRIKTVPVEVAPTRFQEPFVLEVEDEAMVPRAMSFGPGTWAWTPMAGISPYMESAVLVCEDGRFLRHSGFDTEALQNSIRENLRSRRFARGGSTISMQLAKNLYLRRDKTLSRKLQEAGLTLLLEQSLGKRQLLELYLNVIEYGSGIYGIGPAARHYFDTTPERLTLAQAFFLGSILPNPKAQHFGADGLLSPGWLKQLRYLMAIAAKRGHVTEEELAAGLLEHPAFKVPGEPPNLPSRRVLGGEADYDEAEPLPPPVE